MERIFTFRSGSAPSLLQLNKPTMRMEWLYPPSLSNQTDSYYDTEHITSQASRTLSMASSCTAARHWWAGIGGADTGQMCGISFVQLDSPCSQAAANHPPFIGSGSSTVAHGHRYTSLRPHANERAITAEDPRPFYLHCFPKCVQYLFQQPFWCLYLHAPLVV
jgi:hypothetical protein